MRSVWCGAVCVALCCMAAGCESVLDRKVEPLFDPSSIKHDATLWQLTDPTSPDHPATRPTTAQPVASRPAGEPPESLAGPYVLNMENIVRLVYDKSPLVAASREGMIAAEYGLTEFRTNLSRLEPFVRMEGEANQFPERRDSRGIRGEVTGGLEKESFDGAVFAIEGGASGEWVRFGEVDEGQKKSDEGSGGLVRGRVEIPFVGSRKRQNRVISASFQESSARGAKLSYLTNYRSYALRALNYYAGTLMYLGYIRAYEHKLELLEELLNLGQTVVGLDNFSTGHKHNLEELKNDLENEKWERFHFIEADITNLDDCLEACDGIDYILHQAALGSVPRSIDDPIHTNQSNIDGFLNILVAAKETKVKRFVYAASSSTYGDHQELPKIEDRIGSPLSPYAVTKYVNELYADVFSKTYGIETIGLRYFNVFGKRQDPNGAYAAVMPKWFSALIKGEDVFINGDGETSRDFCFIDNCVQANLLSACTTNGDAVNQVYNVAYGARTTLNELFGYIRDRVIGFYPDATNTTPTYRDFRPGDVRHSLADISKARERIGYEPQFSVQEGLDIAAKWYVENI